MMDPIHFSEELASVAKNLGAYSVASIRMDNPLLKTRIAENAAMSQQWIADGYHGEMDYLERMAADKANPWSAFPFAKTALVVAFTNQWGHEDASHPFPEPAKDALIGYISAYAKETDYHTTGQTILAGLKEWIGEDIQTEAAVDTKAVYERLFAEVGGLGEVGANGLLRVPGRQNVRVFLGVLFVEPELPEVILKPHFIVNCATCQACVKKCPSNALLEGGKMDARRCISYLTIEKRSVLNPQEQEWMGDWLFGCDDCSTVCPPKDKIDRRIPVDLEWLLKSSAGEIRRTMKGNATAYAGVTQLRKNAVIILRNMNSPRANELLEWVSKNSGSDLVLEQIGL